MKLVDPTTTDILREIAGIPGHACEPGEVINGEVMSEQQAGNIRHGITERMKYLLDVVNKNGLGEGRIIPFPDGVPGADDPYAENSILQITVGNGREIDVLQGHIDTVRPHKQYYVHGVDPYSVQPVRGTTFVNVLGGYDMLASVAAKIRSLFTMKVHPRRKLEIDVWGLEEGISESLDAAEALGLLKDRRSFTTFEIPVGSSVDDCGELLVGRNGSATFEVTVFPNERIHEGDAMAMARNPQAFLPVRGANVWQKLFTDFRVPERAPHKGFMPPPSTYPKIHSEVTNGDMTTSDAVVLHVRVMWNDTDLTDLTKIQSMLQEYIAGVLCDDNFLVKELKRSTEYLRPWLEPKGLRFIENVRSEFGKVLAASSFADLARVKNVNGQPRARVRAGLPVAEECGITRRASLGKVFGRPVVTIPPKGAKEHQYGEVVDMRYTDEVMIPTMHALAAFPEPLADD